MKLLYTKRKMIDYYLSLLKMVIINLNSNLIMKVFGNSIIQNLKSRKWTNVIGRLRFQWRSNQNENNKHSKK